jgi:hypothetical protein
MEKPFRSQAYQQMYDDEFMMQTFGTLTPDIKTRTAHFFDLWMQWRHSRVILIARPGQGRAQAQNRSRALIRDLGYREFHDFQIRQGEIRFASPDIMAMALMAGLKEYVENTNV